jgi:lipopolysaccharide transport system permease protein
MKAGHTGSRPNKSKPIPAEGIRSVLIQPKPRLSLPDFHELWSARSILYFLTWRDLKIRYKQTLLGAGWAILQPVLLMIVFTFVLGNLAGVRSEGAPYPLFAFSALVPWTLFSQSLVGSSSSLVNNAHVITKIYFPRLIVPTASAASYLFDYLLALVMLCVLFIYYGEFPEPERLIWLVPLTALTVGSALSIGIWLAALNVKYRDIRYAVPFLMQVLLFASPVGYSATAVADKWQLLYALNPMAGIASAFRWMLLPNSEMPKPILLVSLSTTAVALLLGLIYFATAEKEFADLA